MTAIAADAASPDPASNELEEIVVIGTSIAQKLESFFLAVTLLTSGDIAKSGFTSITDLIQNLPAMQSFVPASSSVNDGVDNAESLFLGIHCSSNSALAECSICRV